MSTLCVFCESIFADPIQPTDRQKIFDMFDVAVGGRKLLHDGKICSRCQLQVYMLENVGRLKADMNRSLQEKLVRSPNGLRLEEKSLNNHDLKSKIGGGSMLSPKQATSPPVSSPDHSLAAQAGLADYINVKQEQLVMHASPVLAESLPTHVCPGCHQVFSSQVQLMAHSTVCNLALNALQSLSNNNNALSTEMKDLSGNDQMRGQSPNSLHNASINSSEQSHRRGRPPSTPVINECKKCGLTLKNRQYPDKLKHLEKCTGSGLKRGRPSTKSTELRLHCPTCSRVLPTKYQLDMHVAACDGSRTEKRGRKSGDNRCLICGLNLIYRHKLKIHLKQVHRINYQHIEDNLAAAVHGSSYNVELLQKIKIQLAQSGPRDSPSMVPLRSHTQEAMSRSAEMQGLPMDPTVSRTNSVSSPESAIPGGHRKQSKPQRIVPATNSMAPLDALDQANISASASPSVPESDTPSQASPAPSGSPCPTGSASEIDENEVQDVVSSIASRATNRTTSRHSEGVKGSALGRIIDFLGTNQMNGTATNGSTKPAVMT